MGLRKKLDIIRGGSTINKKCENGDVYDSKAILTNEVGKLIYSSEYWNTDSTTGYNGGRLQKGIYYAIKSKKTVTWQTDPIDCLKLFSFMTNKDKIKTANDLSEKALTLPSEIPNPNHEGRKIVTFVQCHPGSLKWDWSHACMTALNYSGFTEFDRLMSCLTDNEIIVLELK